MDEFLINTFLAVVATESFVAASERLNVTQSTVSTRIQKLEDQIGHQLFVRSKSGVVLTRHGTKFEHYARTLVQIWSEARYQTALPEGFTDSLSLACEDSLWPELAAEWVTQLTKSLPSTAISVHTSLPRNISNMLLRGILDMGLIYSPQIRQGFQVEEVLNDLLVLVTGVADHDGKLGDDYVYTNWGTEFAKAHSLWFPELKSPQLMLQIGPALAQFLITNKKTAFMPYRIADDFVASGHLRFVKESPDFQLKTYAVWTKSKPPQLIDIALKELRIAAKNAPWIELKR